MAGYCLQHHAAPADRCRSSRSAQVQSAGKTQEFCSQDRFPRIGYLLRTFPVLSETFVAGEIRTVAALTGQPPVVAAFYRPGPGQGGGWRANGSDALLYWNDIDKSRLPELALSHAGLLAGSPLRALDCLLRAGREGLSLKNRIKFPALATFFRKHGVQHLHSHFGWEQADMLAYWHRLTGLPFSLTLHAADIFVSPDCLERRISGAAFVATISEYNRALLVKRLGVAGENIHVVHCGVNLPAFPFTAAPEAKPARIVSIGRMVPKKGFDVLLRALALLRTQGLAFEAALVGDGPLRDELARLAATLGLADSVRFTGALEPQEAASRLGQAHILALACRTGPDGDMDGIPVVLMEAMALGRPVVSTRLSGIPELVTEGCGLLAEPGDPYSLAHQLQRVLTDGELAARLALAGRRRVEQAFTLEGQAQRILELAAGRCAEVRT
jgi:colanic acid/amylovoran biosynthesis glycosyltransferase